MLFLVGGFPAHSQWSFQVPIVIQNGTYAKPNRLGVNPGNTIGLDRDTTLLRFMETSAPPLPPGAYPLDSRFVTIPGRTEAYPEGLWGGVYNDFHGFQDSTQIDSFRVQVRGRNLQTSPTTISWPAHLEQFAESWTITSIGSPVVNETDMVSVRSVTIPANPASSVYDLLIIMKGLRRSVLPAGSVSKAIEKAGVYHFDEGSNPYDRNSNQTAVSIDIPWVSAGGVVTVERHANGARDVHFAGDPPAHLADYRWVITQTGFQSFSADVTFEHTLFNSGVENAFSIVVCWRSVEGSGAFTPMAQATSPDPLLVRVGSMEVGEFTFGANDGQLTSVAQHSPEPSAFRLEQNFPNPFNPTTTIRYVLPYRSHSTLTVFNTLGQQVASLADGTQEGGYHEVKFDGSGLASGVYYCRMQAGSFVKTKKLLLLR